MLVCEDLRWRVIRKIFAIKTVKFLRNVVDTLIAQFTASWGVQEPSETLYNCSPESVNKQFHFSWEPWWWWKNQGGWIAAFAVSGSRLLCGGGTSEKYLPRSNNLFTSVQ